MPLFDFQTIITLYLLAAVAVIVRSPSSFSLVAKKTNQKKASRERPVAAAHPATSTRRELVTSQPLCGLAPSTHNRCAGLRVEACSCYLSILRVILTIIQIPNQRSVWDLRSEAMERSSRANILARGGSGIRRCDTWPFASLIQKVCRGQLGCP